MTLAVGQTVQTPLGKGVVLEVRNERRVVVQVGARAVTFAVGDISPASESRPARGKSRRAPDEAAAAKAPPLADGSRTLSIDLHGLTVEQALDALIRALDRALREDASELRVIHGRSGTRLRRAVHVRLGELSFVRSYRLVAGNDGVTIVQL